MRTFFSMLAVVAGMSSDEEAKVARRLLEWAAEHPFWGTLGLIASIAWVIFATWLFVRSSY